jgi:hypothetical protein
MGLAHYGEVKVFALTLPKKVHKTASGQTHGDAQSITPANANIYLDSATDCSAATHGSNDSTCTTDLPNIPR